MEVQRSMASSSLKVKPQEKKLSTGSGYIQKIKGGDIDSIK